MQYTINNFRDEGDNKLVGFEVTDINNNILFIDKQVALENGKSDERYIEDAMKLATPDINEWSESLASGKSAGESIEETENHVGKQWDNQKSALIDSK
jgi:hypothetical protein